MTVRRLAIVETNATGGLIHFAYQMSDALSGQGVEVTLITSGDYELGRLPHRFSVKPSLRLWPMFDRNPGARKQKGVRAALRRARRVWRGVLFFAAWVRLTAYLLRQRPDGVILSMIHSPFQVLYYRVLSWAGIPLIQICHEIEQRDARPGKWDRFVAEPLLNACYRSFSAVVFLAQTVQREFGARYGNDLVTIVLPHGPQLIFPERDGAEKPCQVRYGIGPDERVVLFFGLLRPSKGVADLVDAFARIKDVNRARLLIAGYPTKPFDVDALRAQIDHGGLSDRVSLFLDYVPIEDVGVLLRLADVVVFPYRSATASGAAAAAQSLGRPVVVTSVGGLSETVRDGETGFVVPPGDPAALAQAISRTLDDRDLAARMGAAGREEIMKERSWGAFAKRVLELLEKARA